MTAGRQLARPSYPIIANIDPLSRSPNIILLAQALTASSHQPSIETLDTTDPPRSPKNTTEPPTTHASTEQPSNGPACAEADPDPDPITDIPPDDPAQQKRSMKKTGGKTMWVHIVRCFECGKEGHDLIRCFET